MRKQYDYLTEEVSQWFVDHPFNHHTFEFSAHIKRAENRKNAVDTLPLRKPSRLNGAEPYACRDEGARRPGDPNWTARLRKSGRDADYIIVVSPHADGTYTVCTYWAVNPGADEMTTWGKDGWYYGDHAVNGPWEVN